MGASNSIAESPGVYLATKLAEGGYDLSVFASIDMKAAEEIMGTLVTHSESLSERLSTAEMVVIVNPDPAFTYIQSSDFRHAENMITVVDEQIDFGLDCPMVPLQPAVGLGMIG